MKLYIYIAAATILISLGGALYLGIYNSGAANQRLAQEKSNAKFKVQTNKGAVDFDTCDIVGGLYDFRKGTCKLP